MSRQIEHPQGRVIAVQQQIHFARELSEQFDMTPELLMSYLAIAGFELQPDLNEVMLDAAAISARLKAENREFRVVKDDDNPTKG